jgi:hypothetical protein
MGGRCTLAIANFTVMVTHRTFRLFALTLTNDKL